MREICTDCGAGQNWRKPSITGGVYFQLFNNLSKYQRTVLKCRTTYNAVGNTVANQQYALDTVFPSGLAKLPTFEQNQNRPPK